MTIINNVLKTKTLDDLQVSKPARPPQPVLTTEKVEETISLLREIEINNGYLGIAKKAKLSCSQVKEVHQAMKLKIVELTPVVKTEGVL
jgi:hypothetical protein